MYKDKNFFFRINSDINIGLGHLARCIILAKYLKNNCYFIVDKKKNKFFKNLNLNFISLYENNKYNNELTDALLVNKIIKKYNNAILIVDDYRLGFKWHKYFKKRNIKIIVIDDLLNRKFDPDIYINFKLDTSKEFKSKINKLVSNNSIKLIGPKYSIFDKNLKKKKDIFFNVMFNFGNSFDFHQISKHVIKIYQILNTKIKKLKFYITIGNGSKNYQTLFEYSRKNQNLKIIYKKFGISTYLNKVDLFIGSASTSIYEMSFLKTPSIFIILNRTQDYKIFEIEKLGHYFLINLSEFKSKIFLNFLTGYIDNFNSIKKLFVSRKIKIDNMGAKRVVKVIKKII